MLTCLVFPLVTQSLIRGQALFCQFGMHYFMYCSSQPCEWIIYNPSPFAAEKTEAELVLELLNWNLSLFISRAQLPAARMQRSKSFSQRRVKPLPTHCRSLILILRLVESSCWALQ